MSFDGDEAALERLISAVTGGRGLYRWQQRLLRSLLDGERWDAIDVPTGLGKTSVIALWTVARAAGAPMPRRLVYVVDRRAIVDQATAEAERVARGLAALIRDDPSGPVWRKRLGLGASGGATDRGSLAISTLRGQHLDNRRWLEDPEQSAIIIATVDMSGSRLLFSGYGVSRWQRPLHAAFLGVDSLVVLDEAHLVPPFEALLRQVRAIATADAKTSPAPALVRPLQVMSLSATQRTTGARVFALTDDDLRDKAARARLQAVKRLRVDTVATPADITARLAEHAWALGSEGRRIVVFCNSRKTAQNVEAILSARALKTDGARAPRRTELLTGERRYRERLRLTGDGTDENPGSQVFRRFRPGGHAADDDGAAFLIATSAGEVGVDLDADDMVCDLVAWERMVQRLGRVNRRAVPGIARVVVVPVAGEKEAEDAIEAAALARLLAPFESTHWPESDGTRDASPLSLSRLSENAAMRTLIRDASSRDVLRPRLTRAEVEAWSFTSLDEHTGRPKVQPWLRGWVDQDGQTRMVWRRLFPLRLEGFGVTPALKAFFESAAPPHPSEALDAPSWRVAEVLRERAGALVKTLRKRPTGTSASDDPLATALASETAGGDAEEDAGEAPSISEAAMATRPERTPAHEPVVVVLGSDGEVEELWTAARIVDPRNKVAFERSIANATVVVDARFGGIDEHGLLGGPKADGPLVTVDLDRGTKWELDLATTIGRRITFGRRPERDAARHLRESRGSWRIADFAWSAIEDNEETGIWVELWRGAGNNPGDPAISAAPQALDDHLAETMRQAERIADAIGLDEPYRSVLVEAARLHDVGKDRRLWQDAMGAGIAGRPFAKTGGGGDGRALNGYRHEFGSLVDVSGRPDRAIADELRARPDLTDLVLHLIAAHHGRARPEIAAFDPEGSEPPSRSVLHARDAALRFARLQAAWGAWGLAWWESLLRAADQAASRKLNEGDHG